MNVDGIVIGLSGPLAAGKSTLATYAASAYDATVIRSREIVEAEVLRRGLAVSRETLQDVGQAIQAEYGCLWMTEQMLGRVQGKGIFILDALRHVVSRAYLHEQMKEKFIHLHLTAPIAIRRDRYAARSGTREEFDSASIHPVEADTESLAENAYCVLDTRAPLQDTFAMLGAIVERLVFGRTVLSFQSMLRGVRDFHERNGFEIDVKDPVVLAKRLPLLMEEIGEIARWATKQEGDIAEEHADALILLLGNAVALGFDLETAFIRKLRKILARSARTLGGEPRVSHWGKTKREVETRIDRLLGEDAEASDSEHQLSLFKNRNGVR